MVAQNLHIITTQVPEQIPPPSKSENDSESVSLSSRSSDFGVAEPVSSDATPSEASSEASSKKLISKPILEGKTCTTILYEIIASIEDPISIKYFQVETTLPRTRDTRFKIECHLNDRLYGIGEGSSKKAAKQLASKVALDRLLHERPYLREDVGRVRKGFPSKKKIHMRRNRDNHRGDSHSSWRRHGDRAAVSNAPHRRSFDAFLELQERRRLAMEFEAVNRIVSNIEQLNSYVGFDDMTPYEAALLHEHPTYLDSSDFQRALFVEEFERSLYNRDMERSMNQPDTFEFMRRMQQKATKKPRNFASKLNIQAKEFNPNNFMAREI